MKKRIALLAFITCIIFAVSSLASSQVNYKALYEKLFKDYNTLKMENQKLKNELATLKKKNEELQKKATSLPKLSQYDILVNGVPVANGVNFLNYGGRRYVHFDAILKTFRNVGDMGYIFNDQTKRVEIGALVKNKSGVWLSDLAYFNKDGLYDRFDFNSTDIKINSNKFYKNIWWEWSGSENSKFKITYKLHGKYRKLQFKYGIHDESCKGAKAAIRVFGDNEFLAEYTCELYDDPKSATVDITGVNYLTFEFENLIYASNDMWVVICDPLLIP